MAAPLKQTPLSISTHSFSGKILADYPLLVRDLLLVKRAAALANYNSSLIDKEVYQAIEQACLKLQEHTNDREFFACEMYQGGGGVAIHYNINEMISEFSGQDLGTISLNQSTSDVVYTAFCLSLDHLLDQLVQSLDDLAKCLLTKATKWRDIEIDGRTCMQKASRTKLGYLFSGYGEAFRRNRANLLQLKDHAFRVNLGGTVFGQSDGADGDYILAIKQTLPEILQRNIIWRDNLLDCAQNSDEWNRLSQEIEVLCANAQKLTKDLRLLSTDGDSSFGIIELPHIIKGSSFYSHKNNPTLLETLLQCSFIVKGKSLAIRQACEHGELQLNVFIPFIGTNLYEQMSILRTLIDKTVHYSLKDMTLKHHQAKDLA